MSDPSSPDDQVERRAAHADGASFSDARVTVGGAGAQVGDVRVENIAGRDINKPTFIQIFGQLYPPGTPYAASVRSMVEYYEEVFGGRDAELDQLDAWLADGAKPYAFLYAPTGRGKTALLIHWVARVRQRQDWHVIFVPISIRYQTAGEAWALGALASALAAFHDDQEFRGYNAGPGQLRPTIADYLRRPAPDGRRLLLVLDGLDEATGWTVGADLFPRTPPPHLRVLAAAREYAHTTRRNWYDQLNWRPPTVADIALGGLSAEAVADVLRQMGNPLDQLATDVDVRSHLARVSNGDPITIRFLVEALRDGDLTPEQLAALPGGWKSDGLKVYVQSWLDELASHGAAAPLSLLKLCAGALGPLTSEDVQRLAPDVFDSGPVLHQAAKSVSRFLIGAGTPASGYVFSHPRLRELFWEELLFARDRAAVDGQFVAYGRQAWAEGGQPAAYVRQFWVAHLARAGEWALAREAVTGIDRAAGTAGQRWAALRYQDEGSYSGYLSDVEQLWCWAEQKHDVPLQLRCGLIVASIRSLSAGFQPELLVGLVTVGTPEGKWSPAAVIEYVRQMPDGYQQVRAYIHLASHLPNDQLPGLLEAARAISEEWNRATVLSALAPVLPAEQLPGLLEAARAINAEGTRATVLSALAQVLPAEQLSGLLETARAIRSEWSRAEVLSALAPVLPAEQRPVVVAEALEAAWAISDDRTRARVLSALVHPCITYYVHNRPLWQHTLRMLAQRGRASLFSDLTALMPWLCALICPPERKMIYEVIDDVAAYWP